MTQPAYQGLQKEDIPVILSTDAKVTSQVISGRMRNIISPAQSITGLSVLNVKAKAGGKELFQIPQEEIVLLYVLHG